MLLAIDVGNSHTVIGLYDAGELREHWRIVTSSYRTSDELRILFAMLLQNAGVSPSDISGCCVASVVPQLNAAIQAMSRDSFGIAPVMVEPGVKTGLTLQCENPKEVGADRIANAVGAIQCYPGALIVVDFGTATTFDVITARAEWRGGVIVPGVQLSADALFDRCALLPRVEILIPEKVIGRDTVANIRSGLTYGYADLVDGLLKRIAAEMGGTPTVVATGGLAPVIAEVASRIDEVDPQLTLKGLVAIYEKNFKKAP